MSKINLKASEVQVRENRLGSVTGYEGTAKDLVEKARAGTLQDKNRSFSQCLGCSTSNAACTVVLVQDAAVISHGPVGCAGCLQEYAFTYRVNGKHRGVKNPTQRRIFSTNMEEADTVYGGNQKLSDAIREVHKRVNPNAIFIITTCASGIIGDDVGGIADEAEAELGIPVVAIFCEGFRSKIWTSGFDAGYHAIARKLIKKTDKKQPDLINIVNFWGTDIFAEWFKRLGLRANYLTPYATVKQISTSAEAAATIQICSTLGSYLAAALEQEYNVPEIRVSPPYGIEQTDRWFRELGKMTGKEKEAEQFIKEEKEKWLPEIEKIRNKLKGKTAYVTAGASHGHSLLALLKELGMQPQGAAIFHHDPIYDNGAVSNDTLQNVVNDYGDIANYNVCNKQEFELVNILNKVRPDILLARHGGMTLWGAKFGIPSLLIGDEHYGMGYEGIVKYGNRILETIENDEFVKNLEKHTIKPYSKWWLEQNPYLFLGGNTDGE
ncbi:nitrogenase component 1 [Endomicrobium proavitum]|uniref:Nitrogenase alpha subunit n=1 Tax=Endomicrobium proavitum TaxID=1408281 RepID=A0A0G3WKQ6_9BACT|nr:nitrogenase component 1 [Endomicrobium proavitum]AKL98064.1 Nitrogenase alpha subunit [Endomicrobium proavitum]